MAATPSDVAMSAIVRPASPQANSSVAIINDRPVVSVKAFIMKSIE